MPYEEKKSFIKKIKMSMLLQYQKKANRVKINYKKTNIFDFEALIYSRVVIAQLVMIW